jgi:tetratricopeptide (TPR) repeat protein
MVDMNRLERAKNLINSLYANEILEGLEILESFDIRVCKDLNEKIEVLYNKARAQEKLKKYTEASENLQIIIQLQPENYNAQDLLRRVNNSMHSKNNFLEWVNLEHVTILGAIALAAVAIFKLI